MVTHFRARDDASEKEMEALALLMGHSVKMQRDTYDRRTQQQKVEPAVGLLARQSGLLAGEEEAAAREEGDGGDGDGDGNDDGKTLPEESAASSRLRQRAVNRRRDVQRPRRRRPQSTKARA